MKVACAASGQSLTREQLDACRAAGYRLMVVNDAWRLAPWADWMFAADRSWWEIHGAATKGFRGERWTLGDEQHPKPWQAGLKLVRRGGSGPIPANANNSGLMALFLAVQRFGATDVVLLGYDMQGDHFFGPHPPKLRRRSNFPKFIRTFNEHAPHLLKRARVVNCTPGSALKCFPMISLEEALAPMQAAA